VEGHDQNNFSGVSRRIGAPHTHFCFGPAPHTFKFVLAQLYGTKRMLEWWLVKCFLVSRIESNKIMNSNEKIQQMTVVWVRWL